MEPDLETFPSVERISNGIIATCNVFDEDMKVPLGCNKKEREHISFIRSVERDSPESQTLVTA